MITNDKTSVRENQLVTAIFKMFCELFSMFRRLCADLAEDLLIDQVMTELASIM